MFPFIIPAVVCTSFALLTGFATSVVLAGVATTSAVLAGVAAISSPLLITAGLGTVAAACTSLVLMASFAVSVFLAGVAAICTPLVLMAGFAVLVILAGVAAICGAFLIIAGLAASHFFGFINLTPLFLGLRAIATKLTFLVAARAAIIRAWVTLGLAQFLGVEKEPELERTRNSEREAHVL